MPKTIKHRNASSRLRKGVHPGKDFQGKGRQGGKGTAANGPKIIGDSLFALTLAPKPGLEVIDKTKGRVRPLRQDFDEEDYEQMYEDLLICVQRAVKIITGEVTKFDPLKERLDLSVALTYVINCFESNVLPKGFEYNVDKDPVQGYYFTIYRDAPFDDLWHAFELKPIAKHLWQTDKTLHGLFLLVIKCFYVRTDIGCWWNGGCEYADYMFEEKLQDWESRYEGDDEGHSELDEAIATYLGYEIGEANEYKEALKNIDFVKPELLLKKLTRFDQKNKIVKWMVDICSFCMLKGNVNDFIYYEMQGEGVEGLQFDQQVAIIWDWNDAFTEEQMECIDSEAQGCGVLPPILNFHFTKTTQHFDREGIMAALDWPRKLSDLFRESRRLIESLEPKKEKTNAKR